MKGVQCNVYDFVTRNYLEDSCHSDMWLVLVVCTLHLPAAHRNCLLCGSVALYYTVAPPLVPDYHHIHGTSYSHSHVQ